MPNNTRVNPRNQPKKADEIVQFRKFDISAGIPEELESTYEVDLWKRTVNHLHESGMLAALDWQPLIRYVKLCSKIKKIDDELLGVPAGHRDFAKLIKIQNGLQSHAHKLEVQYGMSPISRRALGSGVADFVPLRSADDSDSRDQIDELLIPDNQGR